MSTALLANPAAPITHHVASRLLKAGLAFKSWSWKEAVVRRISPTQGQILVFLQTHPRRPPTLSVLAQEMLLASATACEAVRALERKGLIRKVRGTNDARAVFITLSAKGRREAKYAAAWSDLLTAAARTLTPSEQKVLLRALTKMTERLCVRDERPTGGTRPANRHAFLASHALAARRRLTNPGFGAPDGTMTGGRPNPSRRETQ